eukprot:GHVO01050903.1.p2 GENE.GHVO01050903.1~~GHVO01050903.1.p2  ORF type:complete len:129 (+),score=27.51 GHVO01050903.1:799-1185(+)
MPPNKISSMAAAAFNVADGVVDKVNGLQATEGVVDDVVVKGEVAVAAALFSAENLVQVALDSSDPSGEGVVTGETETSGEAEGEADSQEDVVRLGAAAEEGFQQTIHSMRNLTSIWEPTRLSRDSIWN